MQEFIHLVSRHSYVRSVFSIGCCKRDDTPITGRTYPHTLFFGGVHEKVGYEIRYDAGEANFYSREYDIEWPKLGLASFSFGSTVGIIRSRG